jgi:hypothetical protein
MAETPVLLVVRIGEDGFEEKVVADPGGVAPRRSSWAA